jgi:PDZ domain-containing secreted protein
MASLPIISQTAFLGIASNQLKLKKSKTLDLPPYGAYISSVTPGSAADQGGLQPFDYITKIGITELTNQNSLHDIITMYQPNDPAKITFIRNKKVQETIIEFGNKSTAKHFSANEENDPFLGVQETHNTGNNNIEGVPVNVGKGSSADLIGLKNGDLITYIDQFRIIDWHDLRAAIDNRKVGDQIEVTVLRDEEFTTLSGPIKSANGHTDLDKKINMQFMKVEIMPMPTEEMEEVAFISEEEKNMPILNDLEVSVFPNPNIGRFTLNAEVNANETLIIQLFDSQGKLIISESTLPSSNSYTNNFDLEISPGGVYYLKVIQKDEIMTKKIIVARS